MAEISDLSPVSLALAFNTLVIQEPLVLYDLRAPSRLPISSIFRFHLENWVPSKRFTPEAFIANCGLISWPPAKGGSCKGSQDSTGRDSRSTPPCGLCCCIWAPQRMEWAGPGGSLLPHTSDGPLTLLLPALSPPCRPSGEKKPSEPKAMPDLNGYQIRV